MKKENEASKDTVIRDTKNDFEHEEEDYYKPVGLGNFWGNNYTEYESNGDRNKISDTCEIQLTIAINFISSKENDEECVMYSKSDNTEFMIYDNADEAIEELTQSLRSRHQIIGNNIER